MSIIFPIDEEQAREIAKMFPDMEVEAALVVAHADTIPMNEQELRNHLKRQARAVILLMAFIQYKHDEAMKLATGVN